MKKLDCQKILINQKGSMTIHYLGLFLLLLLLSLFTVSKNLEAYRKIKERKQNYLCVKTLLHHFEKYNREMIKTNKIIFVNFFLQFNPKTGPAHKKIIEATKLYQEFISLKYIKTLGSESQCSILNRGSFAKNILFKRKNTLLIERDLYERAIPNQLSSWQYLWSSKKFPKLKDLDVFNIQFIQPKNAMSPFTYHISRISKNFLEDVI